LAPYFFFGPTVVRHLFNSRIATAYLATLMETAANSLSIFRL